MHVPGKHPSLTPETSGRGQRFVTNTFSKRPVRLDHLSDSALTWLREILSGEGRDTASVSLVVRRSLRLYKAAVAHLTPSQLAAEKQAVREMSQLPAPRSKATNPS